MPTTPPTLDDLPATPDRSDRATFSARCTALFDQLKNSTIAQWRTAMTNVYNNAVEAFNYATSASSSASSAASAANSALGASNFKGNWSSLTGALNKPASVNHNGAVWLLLNNLADVTTSQPGVSSDWLLNPQGLPALSVSANASVPVSVGQHVGLGNPAQSTATLPAAPVAGDMAWITPLNGRTDNIIARNGLKIMGQNQDLTILDPWSTVALRYINSTEGWRPLIFMLPQFATVDGVNPIGFRGIPQNLQNANYTTVLADRGKHIYRSQADSTPRTWTIAANSSVAYSIDTPITFINDGASGNVSIAINSDTLVLAGTGATGTRTLAVNGIATAVKVTATRWMISGTNLT